MISRRQFGLGLGVSSLAGLNLGACQNTPISHPSVYLMRPDQVRSDLMLAEGAYQRIHPGYTRYADAADLSNAWQALAQRAEDSGTLSLEDLYLGIERILVQIRCDHTKAELPARLREVRKTAPLYLPFLWTLVQGRGFVTAIPEGSPLQKGDELLAINGRTLAGIVETVSPLIPVDGFTDWARRAGVSQSREFMGGAVDHFGALIWFPGPIARLRVKRHSGQIETVNVSRIPFTDWRSIGADTGLAANFKDAVTYRSVGDDVAYLSVDTFVNYRQPVDPDTIYGPIFKKLREENCQTLILDLRQNGGGSTDASHGLVSYLIDQPLQVKTDMRVKTLNYDGLRAHIRTWDQSVLNPDPNDFIANPDGSYSLKPDRSDELGAIQPKPNAFAGQLLILTSDKNASGSTNIMAVLKSAGRAILIGEKTGGSAEGTTAGILFTLELPESGIRTRIPVFRYTNNVKDFEKGLGVTPGIEAPMTVDAFLKGEDPALMAAMKLAGA